MIFYVVLVSFLVLKYVIRFIIPSYPESATILNARHRCIVDKVVKVIKLIIIKGIFKR